MATLIPVMLCAALVLTSSFDPVPGVSPYDGKRLIQVLVFTFLIWLTMAIPSLRSAFLESAQRVPKAILAVFTGAFLLAVISGLRFEHPGYPMAEIAILVTLLMTALCVAASRRLLGRSFDRIAVMLIALLGMVIALQELMGLFANWSMDREFSFDQMLLHFAHPRFYNQLQTWTIPLLASIPLVFHRSPRTFAAAIVLIGLQWWIVLMSGGRGTTLSLVASLALFAIVIHSSARHWLGIQLAGLLLGCMLFGGVAMFNTTQAPEGGEFLEQSVQRPMTHTSGRFHMWRIAWDQARSNPILGIGPGRYPCESTPTSPAHPHNFILQLAAEWGIPATLLVLAGGAWLAWRLLRTTMRSQHSRATYDHRMLVILASSIFAAAIHATLSGVLMTPASQLTGSLVLGWAIGVIGGDPHEDELQGKARAWSLGLLGVIVCTVLLAFTAHELKQMESRLSSTSNPTPTAPRYWQAGRICEYHYGDSVTW